MTTTTENETTKTKQILSYYIFEDAAEGQTSGKPVGTAFAHKKAMGLTLLINGKRYKAYPPKAKTAEPAAAEPATTEGKGA